MNIRDIYDVHLLAKMNKELQEHHVAMYPHEFKPFDEDAIRRYFETCLQNDCYFHIGVFEGDICIGFLQGEFQQKPESPFKYAYKSIHIHQIVVKSAHRKKGVAKALMQETERRAKAARIQRIDLTVWHANEAAHKFNKSYGFDEDLIRMWKEVK